MLHLLPNDVNRLIFEFEGGGWFRTHFSCMVLPELIKECWRKWKRQWRECCLEKIESKRKLLDAFETDAPLIFMYDYMVAYKEYKTMLLVVGFLEKNYWNRMMINPIDSLFVMIDNIDYDNYDDDEGSYKYGIFDMCCDCCFVLHWEATKYFPDEVTIHGNIVEEKTLAEDYENVRGKYYYWNNVYGNGYIYKLIYKKNGMMMMQEIEEGF